ncbi:MAG: hypothetical protein QFF03_12390 [Pseudomonadota bacterium]|nr:hypothetical protein [Pseudomonadota bacterium]
MFFNMISSSALTFYNPRWSCYSNIAWKQRYCPFVGARSSEESTKMKGLWYSGSSMAGATFVALAGLIELRAMRASSASRRR